MNNWAFLSRFLTSRKFPLLLILLGIILRLSNYIYNRSLWVDEAWVANDILTRTFKEIFLNKVNYVGLPAIPPAGFLLIEKSLVNIGGNSEYVLRLFPFLCGALAVILYWALLKKWTSQITAVMALSLFIFTGSLINYSAQCKQYSGEVMVAIVLYLAAVYFQAKAASTGRVLIFALIGMIGMYISHTAIFILGGIAITQTLFLFNSEERKVRWGYLFTYILWAACFILIYVVYLKVMVDKNTPMGKFCINSTLTHFMPSGGIFSLGGWEWIWKNTLDCFQDPLGVSPILLALSMFLLGAIGIFKIDKRIFLMLVLPMVLMIVASGLRKYPFYGRFLLFLVPAALLFMAQAISMITSRGKIGLVLGVLIFFVLMGEPFKSAISNEISPQGREEMRPIVGFLQKEQFPGDSLYMNNSAQYAYAYYLMYYHFDLSPNIGGYFLDSSENNRISLILRAVSLQNDIFLSTSMYRKKVVLKQGVHRFKKRTWLMLSHLYDLQTGEFIKDCFDDRGKLLLKIKRPGVSLYLYELYEPLT